MVSQSRRRLGARKGVDPEVGKKPSAVLDSRLTRKEVGCNRYTYKVRAHHARANSFIVGLKDLVATCRKHQRLFKQ